jgi:hypothetical protein
MAALFAGGNRNRTVICIEDLHWADSSSISLLADVVDKGLMRGATLVVTSRIDPTSNHGWTPCGETASNG